MGGDEITDIGQSLEAHMAKLDRELELEPGEPFEPKLFPELVKRVQDQALFHELDPSRPLVKIGRYDVLDCLGEGGFGCVFKAHDPVLDRQVALKLCAVKKPSREVRLQREARALAKLEHANIIGVHDAGWFEDAGAFYIVTQYVKAANLHDYAVRRRLPWELVFEIFIVLGEALAAAHGEGVVHGDFKPGNVIIDLDTRVPYIVDFGLARIMATEPEEIERYSKGGTLHYMAPELFRGGARTPRSDLYAFCAALWLCIDGHTPYVGNTSEEILADIEIGEPLVVADAVMPEAIREVLKVGLREAPEDRQADMRSLLDQLRRARGPALVPNQPEEVTLEIEEREGDASQPRRGRWLSIISSMLIAGSLVAFGAYLQRSNELDQPEQRDTHFEPAARALREGDIRGAFEMWTAANRTFREVDPRRAGVLTMVLAEDIAKRELDKTEESIPIWMMIGAAESFELAKAWDQAVAARARAIAMLSAVSGDKAADKQRGCQKKNRQHKPCKTSR